VTSRSAQSAKSADPSADPTLALLTWLLNLDGDQPECYDLCWRDYVGQRHDAVLTACRNGEGCPFGRVLLLYPPEIITRAVGALTED
jgi:hypothetical protein